MRSMKYSGIGWVGEMPSHWKRTRVKYLALDKPDSFVDGDWIESTDLADEGIRYLTTGNVGDGVFKRQGDGHITDETFNRLHCKYVYPGDLVISRLNAPYGRSCVIPNDEDKYVIAVDVVILRTDCDKDYLCYVTQCAGYQASVEEAASGTTMKRIGRTKLGNIALPLPPLAEQHRIAKYLNDRCGKIDGILVDMRRQMSVLLQYKNSVIVEATTKGLDKRADMKDSGVPWIGLVPKSWMIDNPKWHFIQRKDRAKPGLIQLTASQKYGLISQDEYMDITGARIVTVQKDFDILKLVCAGDFVIHMRSFQGGLEYSEKTGSTSSAYVMLIPKETILVPRYYKWFFKCDAYIDALNSTTNLVRDGQAMRWANFIQLPIPFPPANEQEEIASYLDEKCGQIDSLIAQKQKQLEMLEAYKKSLIYEYVTGKKEVV